MKNRYKGEWATIFHICGVYDKEEEYLAKNDPYLNYYIKLAGNIRRNRSITGDYQPGEHDSSPLQFNISVNKASFLGFSICYGLNRSDPSKKLNDSDRKYDDDLRRKILTVDLRELK